MDDCYIHKIALQSTGLTNFQLFFKYFITENSHLKAARLIDAGTLRGLHSSDLIIYVSYERFDCLQT